MELFVCSSNYQLLNAIMIVQENKIDADLMITRESIWYDCDINILSQKGVFNEIYKWTVLLECLADEKIRKPSDRIKIQTKKIFTYLNKHSIWGALPNKEKKYEKVHIAYVDSITLWIYTYFKKTGAKLSLFEDGTYSYGCLDIEKPRLRKIAEHLLYGNRGIDECVQMYIKHPERVKLGIHTDVILIKINEQFGDQVVADILLPLYRANKESCSLFKRTVIIFDHNLELDEVKKIQKNIAMTTVDVFGNNNVMVKLHPSSRNVNYGDYICTCNERLPFELVMVFENMNRKLLISIFSTACMSPKLDCDQEPYIIFTYKLYGGRFIIDNTYLEQINQLRDVYSDKHRIAVPNDMNEFIQSITKFKDEIK